MPQSKPVSGEKYRHFKNKLYQIVTIARHSETGEELVVYQALYDDFAIYARPLSSFVSEVDHVKYPDVQQKWRFELVDLKKEESPKAEVPKVEPVIRIEDKLMKFYDAASYKEKYEILLTMQGELNDLMIDNMAVVLDIVIEDGEIETRYEQLKDCLKTLQRYEVLHP